MQAFRILEATACPLPLANVDTDQLIPARFMQRSREQGYGGQLLHDLRFDADGQPRDFELNRPNYAGSRILVARRNFGCGSSREAAVYALLDFGIRCVLAPSFGDIFALNAVNNGLLPGEIEQDAAEALLAMLEAGGTTMLVDLESCCATVNGREHAFTIDPGSRKRLLNGWDDVDLTLEHRDAIAAFVSEDQAVRPWVVPRRPATRPTV